MPKKKPLVKPVKVAKKKLTAVKNAKAPKVQPPAAVPETWEEADAKMRADRMGKSPSLQAQPKPLPVESDKPGVPRVHKPKKVHAPLVAPGDGFGLDAVDDLKVISYHFMKLMERLAAEQGGTSAQALDDLRADIAKRKADGTHHKP